MQEIPRSQNRIRRRAVIKEPQSAAVPQGQRTSVLTRDQYHDLLKMARNMRKILAYLAMRAFVSTGIQLQELLGLTVEEVKTGEITTTERIIHLPESLREELLAYARRNGVGSGVIFVGKAGAPVSAAAVREQIRAVGKAAGSDDGAVSVHLLQKLYETARAELMAQVTERLMLEQLDAEQAEHGWES